MKLFIILLALSGLIAFLRAGSTNDKNKSPTEDKRNNIVKSEKFQRKATYFQKRKAGKRKTKHSKQDGKIKEQRKKKRNLTIRGNKKGQIRRAKQNKINKERRKISEKSKKQKKVEGG